MIKSKLVILVAGFAMSQAFALDEVARWGGKELKEASAAALEHFKAEKGEALFDVVSGVNLEVNSQGNAARAKVTYTVDGVKQTASFFCHTHDVEIDCH